MKRVYTNILGALTVLLFFSSCEKTDGALYSGEPNKISFFSTATSLVMEGGVLSVPVGRTSSDGELSVPVTLTATGTGYTNVFTLAGPITFASGEAKSYAKVNYGDFSGIDPSSLSVTAQATGSDVTVGLAFPFALNIADDNVSPTNKKKIDVNASSILEFDAPVATTMDSWWMEDVIDIEIQKAKGANVFKVVAPYGFRSFAFMVKSDGVTVVCPNQVVDNSGTYGAITMSNVVGKVVDGKVVLTVGGFTVSAGSFGSGQEIITMPPGFLN
ncbi:MAG: hypothetical protein QM594_01885 [Niabella sp.]